jgi:5-methylthioadenosine/S-adenosylhomocysteine deaminase
VVTADLLVAGADWLLTLDRERRIIRDGAVAVSDGRIVAVGKSAALAAAHPDASVVSARGMVVTPGLIDSHIHTTFQMSRGLADEVGGTRFLFERMYPYEAALRPDDALASIRLCVLELLKNGVTTFIDAGNYHPDLTADVVGQAGLRCIVARSSFDVAASAMGVLPPAFIESTAEALARAEDTVKRLHGAHGGRVHAWLQFRGLNNSTDALITGLASLAAQHGVGVQTHACFARDTMEASKRQHGVTEIERLARLGVLGPNLLLVHAGWATERERALLVEHDVKVVAAPSSSLHNAYGNLVQGHAPELLDAGVAVGLGSDHASSGIVDLVQEMRLVAGGYKEVREDAAVMPPERALEMATVHGARCALRGDEVGALEVGRAADLVLFDTARPEWQPLYNPVANLVYSATGRSVATVIVGGRVLVEGGRARTLDEESIIAGVRQRAPRLLKRTGLGPRIASRWPLS